MKIINSRENTWLSNNFTNDEIIAIEYIAQIALSIQKQRIVLGYTQQDLANMLGVSQVVVSRWENGEENFTIATLAKISKALGMALYNPFEKRVV